MMKEEVQGFQIEAALDYVKGYLQRSGFRPFSFRLWTDEFAGPTLFAVLLKYSAFWKEMALVDPSRALLSRLSQFDGNLQRLRKIAFVRYTRGFYLVPWDVLNEVAPNLTDLTLVQVSIGIESRQHIPWAQLTRYCEIDCSWSYAPVGHQGRLSSYRKLTNLCVLCLRLKNSDFRETDTPVELPNVRAAALHFFDSRITKITQSFDMPMLEEFSIEYSHVWVDASNGLDILMPLSSPRLKFFRARLHSNLPFNGQHNPDCTLEMFPDLREISIDVPHTISDTIVSRLIPYNDQLPLCPKLEIIRLSNKSFATDLCKWQTLADMLQARFRVPVVQGISRLCTFEFSTDEVAHDVNVTTGLKALRKRNQWDIRVGDECRFPAWDELHLDTSDF
ncbi:hypothetical protein MVEN_01672200 [Mycena venus]|uniref:Uncharacterized protein n=1 Tax=Mycena venus TaxID=2733690 RepID=A0A8H7CR24_9AGAR|nr:hypothetical protein MVEN_01672200 [Mycena venus]